MEECDATASPNDESPSENDDSDVDPNYSLSDDSYCDSSDSNRTSLFEVRVCALNETQNVEFTIEKGNKKPNSRKRNGKELKTNCYEVEETHGETLKEVLNYLNGRYITLCGHL